MIKIAPSLLSADFSMIKEEIEKLEKAKVDMIHFDVMDNHFVPNLTFGPKFIKDLRKYTELPFDVHLMIANPDRWVDNFLDTGGDIFTFHIEAVENFTELAKKVKGRDKKLALSVKPKTNIESIYPFLDLLDIVLIMTVEPGFGGQELIEETLTKISDLKEELAKKNLPVLIQVDGGVNLDTIKKVVDKGADILVMGSAFFKNEDYLTFIEEVNQLVENDNKA